MDPRLTSPAFWAAHFYLLLGTRERNARDFLKPFFGVSFAEMHEFYESQVERPDGTGDLISLDAGDTAAVALEYADCGDDGSEQRFFITTDAWDDWELLGYNSAHFALPAFRWEEIEGIGAREPLAFTLLLPAVAWPGTEDALRTVERAWRDHPFVRTKDAAGLAQQIADHLYPATELKWWHDPGLGWINDGRYSFRNPKTRMGAFSRERFDRTREFFAAVGIQSDLDDEH